MKKLLILWLSGILVVHAQDKKVCFSIDDLPVVSYGEKDAQFHLDLTDRLMAGLVAYHIPTIGFVNEGKMFDQEDELIPFQKQCLEKWLEAGMELGNHTLKHRDFNTTDFGTFAAEIIIGEQLTKKLLKQYGKEMKYFRHPFLHTGATKERSDSLEQFLISHHYITAPVTIDNDDYLFAQAYHTSKKKGDEKLAEQIGRDYVNYMEEKLVYFETQSQKLFSRDIGQVLLLHASWLNSDFVDDLAEVYKKHGYSFASLEEILKDEAYRTPITKYGTYGISWLDRWAISMGKKGDFFQGEPGTPEYIQNFGR